jgi:hypothetical protein
MILIRNTSAVTASYGDVATASTGNHGQDDQLHMRRKQTARPVLLAVRLKEHPSRITWQAD